jgi:hypothetical protein
MMIFLAKPADDAAGGQNDGHLQEKRDRKLCYAHEPPDLLPPVAPLDVRCAGWGTL